MDTSGELRTTITSTVNGDSGRPSSPTRKGSTTKESTEMKRTEKPSTIMESIDEKKLTPIAPNFQKLKGWDITTKPKDREQEKNKLRTTKRIQTQTKSTTKSTVKKKISKPKNKKNEEAAKNITKMKAYWSQHVTKSEKTDNIIINNVPRNVTCVPEFSTAKQDITMGENHHHHFICKINKLHKDYTRYYVK